MALLLFDKKALYGKILMKNWEIFIVYYLDLIISFFFFYGRYLVLFMDFADVGQSIVDGIGVEVFTCGFHYIKFYICTQQYRKLGFTLKRQNIEGCMFEQYKLCCWLRIIWHRCWPLKEGRNGQKWGDIWLSCWESCQHLQPSWWHRCSFLACFRGDPWWFIQFI